MDNKNKYSQNKSYKVVAFFAPNFANDEQARNISLVHKISKEYGCKVIFFSTISDFHDDDVTDSGEKKIFECAAVERFDAVVVMAGSFKQDEDMMAMVQRANAAGVPVIAIDKVLEGCMNLCFSYGDSFKEVVKHMVEEHGYRKIFFMDEKEIGESSDKLLICKEILESGGSALPESRIYGGCRNESQVVDAMDKMMRNPEGLPQAIVCANDAMAMVVISYLKKRSIRVPEDVAVSGFEGIVMERYSMPRLTTAVANREGMFHKLFACISEGKFAETKESLIIENVLQIGGSCGCNRLNPIDPGEELLKLKTQVFDSARFHEKMNQMVMNLGTEVDQAKVVTDIPSYITLLNYKKLWRCMNTDYCSYMKGQKDIKGLEEKQSSIFTQQLSVMRYEEDGTMILPQKIDRTDLLVDLNEALEQENAIMIVPIHLRGELIGYLGVAFDVDTFAFNLFSSFIINYRHLFEAQRNRVELQELYMCDSLSGLLNRNGFYDAVRRVMSKNENKELALIFLDMDMLKTINDTFGHAEGDSALRFLAMIILQHLEDSDIACRLGGDEFAIAFTGDEVEERAEKMVSSIRNIMKRYNERRERPYPIIVSIGAYCNRIKGHSLDHFLKSADDLMYADKYLHRKDNGIL